MILEDAFLKLPIRFDAEMLAREAAALPATAWDPHPTGFAGNEAVKLVTRGGELTDLPEGAMGPTEYLERCPYVREIMSEMGAVWGRSRFMGLAAGSKVPPHVDIHYYWRTHLRIHIPVVTNPNVEFTCGRQTVNMAAGECWLFDSFRMHGVQNKGDQQRIHLVLDTVGGGTLSGLIKKAGDGSVLAPPLQPGTGKGQALLFEQFNSPEVMSPWEMRCHWSFLAERATTHPALAEVRELMDQFISQWVAAWAQFGTRLEGDATYSDLLITTRQKLRLMNGAPIKLQNGVALFAALDALIFRMALGRRSMSDATN